MDHEARSRWRQRSQTDRSEIDQRKPPMNRIEPAMPAKSIQ